LALFGGADAEENYARPVLKISGDILAQLYALQDLAHRWPPDHETSLSAQAKAQLARMVRDHARGAGAGVSDLEAQVDFLLKGFGYEILTATAATETTWQSASASSLFAARNTDRLLRSLLTTSDNPVSADVGLPQLQQSFRDLQRTSNELIASAL
jgi:hypothetical protein